MGPVVEIAMISLTSAKFFLNHLSPVVYKLMWKSLFSALCDSFPLKHLPVMRCFFCFYDSDGVSRIFFSP